MSNLSAQDGLQLAVLEILVSFLVLFLTSNRFSNNIWELFLWLFEVKVDALTLSV